MKCIEYNVVETTFSTKKYATRYLNWTQEPQRPKTIFLKHPKNPPLKAVKNCKSLTLGNPQGYNNMTNLKKCVFCMHALQCHLLAGKVAKKAKVIKLCIHIFKM